MGTTGRRDSETRGQRDVKRMVLGDMGLTEVGHNDSRM